VGVGFFFSTILIIILLSPINVKKPPLPFIRVFEMLFNPLPFFSPYKNPFPQMKKKSFSKMGLLASFLF